ncbi:hypothetical protein [Pisciglobus halotolerans]|uniref:Uncharacterized protein n=1 Tax=Pisciglobus halotolerans TaxID=745365 RepID=A0A1I3D2H6_9LACT|nr:hypothetical protein [Pisciglobus halotolerans]SFH80984.1 hypothetical protein SAMN04489868_12721 [Pisciglobus halotolerans]
MRRLVEHFKHYRKIKSKRAWIFAVILLQLSVLFLMAQVIVKDRGGFLERDASHSFEQLGQESKREVFDETVEVIEVDTKNDGHERKVDGIATSIENQKQKETASNGNKGLSEEAVMFPSALLKEGFLEEVDVSDNELDLVTGEIKVHVSLPHLSMKELLIVLRALSEEILLNNQDKGIVSVKLNVWQGKQHYFYDTNYVDQLCRIEEQEI